MAAISPIPKLQFFDANGAPLSGGKLYTYAAGTTTPLATYTDYGAGTPNANPVILDSRGEASVWLGSLAYKMALKTSADATVWTVDNMNHGDTATLAALAASGGAALVGYINGGTGAVVTTVQTKLRETVSVLDFGADPTGAADSTAAFNSATQASAAYSTALGYNIHVPSGVYKISSTVFVRVGQTLYGDGFGSKIDATGTLNTGLPAIKFGFSSSGVADTTGPFCGLRDMFVNGGPITSSQVYAASSGYQVHGVHFSGTSGIGLECRGGDAQVSNVEFDLCSAAIVFSTCQNISLTNFNIYSAAYALQFNSNVFDITVSNGLVEYTTDGGVLFGDAATAILGILFNNVDFVTNVQNTSFLGYVRNRAIGPEAQFTGCSFRNWYDVALNHEANGGVKWTFTGCVFDASKTNPAYASSTTARVLTTGTGGIYTFNGCEFRNIPNASGCIATINNSLVDLSITGGLVYLCTESRFNVVTTEVPKITVKGVKGFAFVKNTAGSQAVVLPWWGASTAWRVGVKGNPATVSDADYSRAAESIASATWAYSGAVKTLYFDIASTYMVATRAVVHDLVPVVCNGSAPGGATSTTTYAASGKMCVSVPVATADASNFDWYAETLI